MTPEQPESQIQQRLADTDKLNSSFGNEDQSQGKIPVSDDRSDDRSDNANLFNRVNLRPFELHSNTTSANVSRRGSFLNKTNDERLPSNNVSAIHNDSISVGGMSANVSRNGSFLNKQRPPP